MCKYIHIWQYGLWSFQAEDKKLEKFLHKNQHTQRKLLNFEFWINCELSKKGHHFSNKKKIKKMLSENVNNKKCAPKLVFFNENKIEKDTDDFSHRKLILKVKFWHFLTARH
jgi:hypothetical protein